MKNIMYMVDQDTGLVFSKVYHEVAVPVLDFEGMRPDNGFKTAYNLEKMPDYHVYPYCHVIHTKKIPVELKNLHRKFWGMEALKIAQSIVLTFL